MQNVFVSQRVLPGDSWARRRVCACGMMKINRIPHFNRARPPFRVGQMRLNVKIKLCRQGKAAVLQPARAAFKLGGYSTLSLEDIFFKDFAHEQFFVCRIFSEHSKPHRV
eukprot:530681-Rhodomonas_salina.2